MARNVRDLRDIINVSRLSIRSDEEEFFSSSEEEELKENCDDLEEYLSSRPSSAMGMTSSFNVLSRSSERPPTAMERREFLINNKGIRTNRPFTAPSSNLTSMRTTRPQNENKGRVTVPLVVHHEKLPFPSKYTPVPPIPKKGGKTKCKQKRKEKLNFDHIFEYLDSTIVNAWLEECNRNMEILTEFVLTGKNFIHFASFFLSEMSFDDYCNLLDLEFSIIIDRLKYGLHAGYSISFITDNDLRQMASAVLPEYPDILKDKVKGIKHFLDIFLVVSSTKTEHYRSLLKWTNCYTINKHFVQWLLAIRAHGLISFLTGILRFYKDFQQNTEKPSETHTDIQAYDFTDKAFENVYKNWVIWCIQDKDLNVLDYLYKNKDIDIVSTKDDKNRNLLFVAIDAGNEEALYYLCQIEKRLVNERGENGNTPLMYAVNKNDLKSAKFLIEMGAEVDQWNEQADGATALHLCVLLGLKEMLQLLINMGADPTVCMGVPATVTPLKLAQELGNKEIINVLSKV